MCLSTNKLKLNLDKMDFLIFILRSNVKNSTIFFPVDILGNFLSPAEVVGHLGVVWILVSLSQAISGAPV